jgi:hypothetical protein
MKLKLLIVAALLAAFIAPVLTVKADAGTCVTRRVGSQWITTCS